MTDYAYDPPLTHFTLILYALIYHRYTFHFYC
jgi:hypothetical protein